MPWVLLARRIKKKREAKANGENDDDGEDDVGKEQQDRPVKSAIKGGMNYMKDLVVGGSTAAAAAASMATPPMPDQKGSLAKSGRDLLSAALGGETLMLFQNHILDENAEQYARYNLISVPNRATVTLVEGNLRDGLGGGFQDYIKVDYRGKVGLISKYVVQKV